MGAFIDLTSKRFGKWVVLKRIYKVEKRTHWFCQCNCGQYSEVDGNHLRGGHSTQCKTCHNVEAVKQRPIKHGNCINGNTKEYRIWSMMKTRCTNIKHDNFPSYGGRGIIFCKSWDIFENFLKDMGKCPKKMTLDRIDNEKGYSPENCKWSTAKQQCRNKRSNHYLEAFGKRLILTDWVNLYKIPMTSFVRKMKKEGWPFSHPPELPGNSG